MNVISFVDIKVIVLNNGHFEQFFLQKWPFISIQHIMVILIWNEKFKTILNKVFGRKTATLSNKYRSFMPWK